VDWGVGVLVGATVGVTCGSEVPHAESIIARMYQNQRRLMPIADLLGCVSHCDLDYSKSFGRRAQRFS
jgi:hypothetical protein